MRMIPFELFIAPLLERAKTANAMAGFVAHKTRLQAAPSLEERAVILDHMKQDAEVAKVEANIRLEHRKEQMAVQKEQDMKQKMVMAKQKQDMAKRKMEMAQQKEEQRAVADKQKQHQAKIKQQQNQANAKFKFDGIMKSLTTGQPQRKMATEYFAGGSR